MPDRSRRIAVQDDDDGVAGRVLELLHHQLPTTGSRRPVDATKGLALLVLPDGVEVEPGLAAQEQSAPVSAVAARVAEERVQVDEPRVNGDRGSRRAQGQLDRLEPQVVAERDPGVRELEAATREPTEVDDPAARATASPQTALVRAERSQGPAGDDRADGDPRPPARLDAQPDAIALDGSLRVGHMVDGHGTAHEARPRAGGPGGEHQPHSDDGERS